MSHPYLHAQDLTEAARELDARSSDGISVQLVWYPARDSVSVTVTDVKTGDAFELPVRDGERALDVFQHPYAYAARRGVAFGAGRTAAVALGGQRA